MSKYETLECHCWPVFCLWGSVFLCLSVCFQRWLSLWYKSSEWTLSVSGWAFKPGPSVKASLKSFLLMLWRGVPVCSALLTMIYCKCCLVSSLNARVCYCLPWLMFMYYIAFKLFVPSNPLHVICVSRYRLSKRSVFCTVSQKWF